MCAPVSAVRAWAEKHGDAIRAARAAYDAPTSSADYQPTR
jgi:hypothetical protein